MKCKTYYTKSGKKIRLWHGDCMDLMEGKPENHWDLAIADVQYGIKQDGRNNHTRGNLAKAKDYRDKLRYDDEPPDKKYFDSLMIYAKNKIIKII